MQEIVPRIEDVEWSVQVILASSKPSQNQRPVVHLKLKLRNGEVKLLRLSMESFDELRYKLAESVKIYNEIKQNKIFQNQ